LGYFSILMAEFLDAICTVNYSMHAVFIDQFYVYFSTRSVNLNHIYCGFFKP
jgi:hypothetical protein